VQRLFWLLQGCFDFRAPMQASKYPACRKRGSGPCIILDRVGAVEANDGKDATGSEQIPEPQQRGLERKVVQGSDHCNQVEAGVGKRVTHRIAFDKRDARLGIAGRSGTQESIAVGVDGDHFLAVPCKLSCQQPLAASYVERAPAIGRDGPQYDVVIMNIVVPGAHGSHYRGAGATPRCN